MIVLSTLLTISVIGRPRKPLTPGPVVGIVAINAVHVVILVLAAGELH
jgi:hypothetical protein